MAMNPTASGTAGGTPYATAAQGTYQQDTQYYGEAVPVYVVNGAQNHPEQVYVQAGPTYAAQGTAQGHVQVPSAYCKGCGREFQRKPGVNPASAQYHRCDDCNGRTTRNMLLVNATCGGSDMCTIQ